jgi:glycosyltransferase involved in cell wall biosynthesis
MKVLVVVDGIWPPAVHMTGTSIIYELIKHLSKEKIEVHVLTVIEKWADPSWREWLKKEEEKHNIHFHYISLKIVKVLPKFLWKISYFPIILQLNLIYHFDIIHFYSSSLSFLMVASIFRRFVKSCFVVTFCSFVKGFLGSFRPIRKLPVDKVICTSHFMLPATIMEKAIYLPLGVNFERFNLNLHSGLLRERISIPQKSLVILYVGPILESKGIFTLLEATPLVLKEHDDSIFVIVATFKGKTFRDQSLRDYIEKRSKLLKFIRRYKNNFKFLEGEQNIPLLMALADVVVFPFTTHYGTLSHPLTILEAMAAGKAIVASNIAGVNELIVNEKNGLLFQQGDAHELAKAINALLSSKELREKLGRNAKADAKKYDVVVVAKRLIKVYKELTRA